MMDKGLLCLASWSWPVPSHWQGSRPGARFFKACLIGQVFCREGYSVQITKPSCCTGIRGCLLQVPSLRLLLPFLNSILDFCLMCIYRQTKLFVTTPLPWLKRSLVCPAVSRHCDSRFKLALMIMVAVTSCSLLSKEGSCRQGPSKMIP